MREAHKRSRNPKERRPRGGICATTPFGPYLGGSIRGYSFDNVDFRSGKRSVLIVSYGRSDIWTGRDSPRAGPWFTVQGNKEPRRTHSGHVRGPDRRGTGCRP